MSILKDLEKDLGKRFTKAGFPLEEIHLLSSSRKDLGDYQLNDAMKFAKERHQNPKDIALEMKNIIDQSSYFENVNIAGVGFINLTLKNSFLVEAVNRYYNDPMKDITKLEKERIFIDYGGANIAKTLHVGHVRSANIGESLKRLARYLGKEVISDVHFGDIGRQSGMVIYEIKQRYPNLNYFSGKEEKEWDPLPITAKDLEEIYPLASSKAKEHEEIMEEVREITKELEEGHKGYVA